jgi:hypothetical protein
MKKILLLICISIFTQFANAQNIPTAGAKFSFSKITHDFGQVPQGPDIFYNFEFTNTGTQPLIILDASGSCSCTIPTFDRAPIKPGGKGIVKVKFETKDKEGTFNKTVYIKSNATARNEPFEIFIKGTVLVKKGVKKKLIKRRTY